MNRSAAQSPPSARVASCSADALLADGIAAHQAGRHAEADRCYRLLLRTVPNHAQGTHLLADLSAQAGRWADAARLYRRLVALRPERPDHWVALGAATLRAEPPEQALAACREAATEAAAEPGAWNNLGIALHQTGAARDALAAYGRAIDLAPDFADAHANRGIALKSVGSFEAAYEAFGRALVLRPNLAAARHSRALAALTLGRFDEGWADYPCRSGVDRLGRPPPDKPLPARLDGRRLLVLRDQGLGDELFFLRWVGALRARGTEVAYAPHPKLAPLVKRLDGIEVIAEPKVAPSAFDSVLSVGDLPFLLGPHAGCPPPPRLIPLAGSVARAERALAGLGPRPWIGVTWRAGSKGVEKLDKSVPIGGLGRALRNTAGTIVAVQRNPSPGNIPALRDALGRSVGDLSAWNDDLEAMLGLMDSLDDYVCVSNTNLHLRAGCGKTCRVLVSHPPEFRWLHEGVESPWFPGFSIYRQDVDGDWAAPLSTLAAALHC